MLLTCRVIVAPAGTSMADGLTEMSASVTSNSVSPPVPPPAPAACGAPPSPAAIAMPTIPAINAIMAIMKVVIIHPSLRSRPSMLSSY